MATCPATIIVSLSARSFAWNRFGSDTHTSCASSVRTQSASAGSKRGAVLGTTRQNGIAPASVCPSRSPFRLRQGLGARVSLFESKSAARCGRSGARTLEPASRSKGGGTPGRNRTCDQRLRRPSLYPTELRARYPHRYQTSRGRARGSPCRAASPPRAAGKICPSGDSSARRGTAARPRTRRTSRDGAATDGARSRGSRRRRRAPGMRRGRVGANGRFGARLDGPRKTRPPPCARSLGGSSRAWPFGETVPVPQGQGPSVRLSARSEGP